MTKSAFCLILSMYSLCTEKLAISQPNGMESSAEASLIRIDAHRPMSFQPASDEGFIVVALQNCSLLIDGKMKTLHPAGFEQIKGRRALELASSSPSVTPVVLVTIKSSNQSLTIENMTLAHKQELDDGSDRNATLLVALSTIRLRDARSLNDGDETWKSGAPVVLRLSSGQTAWLKPGTHHLRNLSDSTAKFLTIEW